VINDFITISIIASKDKLLLRFSSKLMLERNREIVSKLQFLKLYSNGDSQFLYIEELLNSINSSKRG